MSTIQSWPGPTGGGPSFAPHHKLAGVCTVTATTGPGGECRVLCLTNFLWKGKVLRKGSSCLDMYGTW